MGLDLKTATSQHGNKDYMGVGYRSERILIELEKERIRRGNKGANVL